MKTLINTERALTRLVWAAACVLLTALPRAHAQEDSKSPKNTDTQSEQASGNTDMQSVQVAVFTIPSSLKEGQDPFFPKSTRFISRPNAKPALGPVVLECKGISGTSERPLAIINNRTFAVGEEQDVNTAQGKVRVLCLEIQGMRVKVRAQGRITDLLYRKGI